MPVKHDAAWWRDHRAKKRAAELSSDQPAAQTGHGAGPAPQGQGVPAVKLPPVRTKVVITEQGYERVPDVLKSATWAAREDPSPVELSSHETFVADAKAEFAKPDPHVACNLLESQLRARIAQLENQLSELENQILGDRLIVDPSPLRLDDLGGVFE